MATEPPPSAPSSALAHGEASELRPDTQRPAEREPSVFVTDPSVEAGNVEASLRARGYQVFDVPLALLQGRIRAQRPDILLVDIDNPGAVSTVAQIRASMTDPPVPILFVGQSPDALGDEAPTATREGRFFVRPIDAAALSARADGLLGRTAPEPGPVTRRVPPSIAKPTQSTPRRLGAQSSEPPPPPTASRELSARNDVHGWNSRLAPSRISPDLERLLREAEARVASKEDGIPFSGIPVGLLTPEEEVEAILPAEILAFLDEPIAVDEPDDVGQAAAIMPASEPSQRSDPGLTSGTQRGDTGERGMTISAHELTPSTISGVAKPIALGIGATEAKSSRALEVPRPPPGGAFEPAADPQTASAHHLGPALPPVPTAAPPLPPVMSPPARAQHPALATDPSRPQAAPALAPESRAVRSRPDPVGTTSAASPAPRVDTARLVAARADAAWRVTPPVGGPTRAAARPAVNVPRPSLSVEPSLGRSTSTSLGPQTPGPIERPRPTTHEPTADTRGAEVIEHGATSGREADSDAQLDTLLLSSPDDAFRAFARAVAARLTGALRFESVAGIRRIVFQDGDVVTAASAVEGESLVAYLAAKGDLPEEVARRVGARLPPFGRLAGAALIAHGYLQQDRLWDVLQAHVSWLLVRIANTAQGRVLFERELPARLKAEPPVFGGTPGPAIIVEVARRAVPAAEALHRLGGFDARITPGPRRGLLDECGLEDREEALVQQAVGVSLQETTAGLGEDGPATVYALVTLGVLDTLAPARIPGPPVEEPADPLLDAELDDTAMRARIAARRALAEDGDYFAVLGVPRDATGYDIRRAYLDLRRSLEPSVVLRVSLLDLSEDLRLILSVLDEAYDVLKDPTRRERYRRAIGQGPSLKD